MKKSWLFLKKSWLFLKKTTRVFEKPVATPTGPKLIDDFASQITLMEGVKSFFGYLVCYILIIAYLWDEQR